MHSKKGLIKVAAITGLALVMTTGIAMASIGTGTVTADALRLRSQANTNSSILTLAPHNSVVTLLEELDGWYKVSYGDQVGYMSADWLDVTLTGSEAVVGQCTVTADALHVRSGAGTGYASKGLVYKGTTLIIQEDCGNGWYKITGAGYSGYVSAEWVKVSGSSGGSDSGSSNPIGTGTVNTACLNVRSGAGTGYSRVGYLYKGNSVSILADCGNGWYKISYGSGSAFVCAEYITWNDGNSGNSGGSDSGSSDTQSIGTITADALNVRSGAGTGYSRLGLLYKGNSVTILGSSNGWYKISYKNGVGYVSAEYVSIKDGGNNDGGNSSTSSIGEKAVALAKQQLGKPYVYGAAGPNSFDCSGLFYYVFNQLGVSIARGSSSQYYNSGRFVSVDEMQPGDLVYIFDSKYDYSGGTLPTTHVLMYIGDNTVLHASTTSNTVRTDTLFGGYYGNYVVAVKRMG